MHINSVTRDCRDLIQQFLGALPLITSEAQFDILKEAYRNQFKGIAYVCREDRNYPPIIKLHFEELEAITFTGAK